MHFLNLFNLFNLFNVIAASDPIGDTVGGFFNILIILVIFFAVASIFSKPDDRR